MAYEDPSSGMDAGEAEALRGRGPSVEVQPLTETWMVVLSDDGEMYYYNQQTGDSVWELPPDIGNDVKERLMEEVANPVLVAVRRKNFAALKHILDATNNQMAANQTESKTGRSAMYLAASMGQDNMLALLITAGGRVNLSDSNGFTPLYVAAQNGHVACVRTLLDYGKANINQAGKDDATPLYIATQKGRGEVVHVLLQHGADVNARKSNGCTALWAASATGNVEMVKIILQRPGVDVDLPGFKGKTARVMAKKQKYDRIVGMIDEYKLYGPLKGDVDFAKANADESLASAAPLKVPPHKASPRGSASDASLKVRPGPSSSHSSGAPPRMRMEAKTDSQWHGSALLCCFNCCRSHPGKDKPEMTACDCCCELFECLFLATLCPCLLAGDIYVRDVAGVRQDECCGHSVLCGCFYTVVCPCCYSWILRDEVITRFQIDEGLCMSCLTASFCCPCSMRQVQYELDYREVPAGHWC